MSSDNQENSPPTATSATDANVYINNSTPTVAPNPVETQSNMQVPMTTPILTSAATSTATSTRMPTSFDLSTQNAQYAQELDKYRKKLIMEQVQKTDGRIVIQRLLDQGLLEQAKTEMEKVRELENCRYYFAQAKPSSWSPKFMNDVSPHWNRDVEFMTNVLTFSALFRSIQTKDVLHTMVVAPAYCGKSLFAKDVAERFYLAMSHYQNHEQSDFKAREQLSGSGFDYCNARIDFSDLRSLSSSEIQATVFQVLKCAQSKAMSLSTSDKSWTSIVILDNIDQLFVKNDDVPDEIQDFVEERALSGYSAKTVIVPSSYLASKEAKTAVTPGSNMGVHRSFERILQNQRAERLSSLEKASSDHLDATMLSMSAKKGGDHQKKSSRLLQKAEALALILAPHQMAIEFSNLKLIWTARAPWEIPSMLRTLVPEELYMYLGFPNADLREVILSKQYTSGAYQILKDALFKISDEKYSDEKQKHSNFMVWRAKLRSTEYQMITMMKQLTGHSPLGACTLETKHCINKTQMEEIQKKLHCDNFYTMGSVGLSKYGSSWLDLMEIANACLRWKVNKIMREAVNDGLLNINDPSGTFVNPKCGTNTNKHCQTAKTLEEAYKIVFNNNNNKAEKLFDWKSSEDQLQFRRIILEQLVKTEKDKEEDYPKMLLWMLHGSKKFWEPRSCPNQVCTQFLSRKNSKPISLAPIVQVPLKTYQQQFETFIHKPNSNSTTPPPPPPEPLAGGGVRQVTSKPKSTMITSSSSSSSLLSSSFLTSMYSQQPKKPITLKKKNK